MKVAKREREIQEKKSWQNEKSIQKIDHDEKKAQNILLVEDNEMKQKIVVKVLETKGLTCEVACNGL